jgi:UDP-N-acetylglucosamine--N-acetylmuramyl-(pentapeptide) pyrophosphoryl-undecaprenol N-acetylglucosamine transferase
MRSSHPPASDKGRTLAPQGIDVTRRTETPRILIAGGGTGGHVLPAIAVFEELQRRGQATDLLWVGSSDGLEREQAAQRDISFRTIHTGKLRRYLDFKTITDAVRIPIGAAQAWRILRSFTPDVVFSTGGFVSVPTVLAAARSTPVITHEQTAILGLANRINARFSDVLAVSFRETIDRFNLPADKAVWTGNPVRSSLLHGDAKRGRAAFGLDAALPLVFVTGGARGASPVNQRIEKILPELLQRCQIIHQTGPPAANDDLRRLTEMRETLPAELRSRYHVREFLNEELADVYAAAALVVCRSGAGMVAELALLGKPSILVPLPGSGGGEQATNATVLERQHAAIVLDQERATPERLLAEIDTLLLAPDKLASMSAQAFKAASPDAAGKLTDLILDMAAGNWL